MLESLVSLRCTSSIFLQDILNLEHCYPGNYVPLHAGEEHHKVLLAHELLHVGSKGQERGDLTAKERQEREKEGPAVVVTNRARFFGLKYFVRIIIFQQEGINL